MSLKHHLWIQVFKKHLIYSSSPGRQTLTKVLKIASLSFAVGSVVAMPTIVKSSSTEEDGNIVASVNGGIRFLRSVRIGIGISLDYSFSMLGLTESSPNYKIMMSRIHQRAADSILQGCLLNGGSYIKLGQGLVSMSHILPKEYITTLKSLQNKCVIREVDELKTLFKEDFGKEPTEVFKEFEEKPIAAASIAQVYKAKTKNDETVAVKVQYIDLQKRFNSDVITIKALLNLNGWMHPNFNFSWVIDNLETTLRQELDFVNEGLNGERCARDLKHLQYIYVPKVFWDYTNSRVLVTEFIDGYQINDIDKLKKEGFSSADINRKLFEAFGHQIFQSGFVHADPHSANILVRKNKGAAQLVLLDHGLYQHVSEKDRIALSHMWKGIVLNDHATMEKYSGQLGVKDYEIFAQILTQAPLRRHNFKLKPKLSEDDLKHITNYARDSFDSIMCCLQTMPTTLLLVIRNLNTIRAIAHDHGNPIDRYDVLARCATKSAFYSKTKISKIFDYPRRCYFILVLSFNRLGRWFQTKVYKFLRRFELVPDVERILAKADINTYKL